MYTHNSFPSKWYKKTKQTEIFSPYCHNCQESLENGKNKYLRDERHYRYPPLKKSKLSGNAAKIQR